MALRGRGHRAGARIAHRSIQFIDARDLAAWMLRLIQLGANGAFNATGPNEAMTFGELLDTCRWVSGEEVEVEWVEERFLGQEGVQPWVELPLWIPASDAQTRGFNLIDTTRARATDLKTRPAAVTISDILEAGIPAPDDNRRHGKTDARARARPARRVEAAQAGSDGHLGPVRPDGAALAVRPF